MISLAHSRKGEDGCANGQSHGILIMSIGRLF